MFYGHFAAAYGTLWLVVVILAVLTQSHVQTGIFGVFGFPIVSLFYAIARTVMADPADVRELEGRLDSLERHTGAPPYALPPSPNAGTVPHPAFAGAFPSLTG